jgi:hypothetical protein
LIDTPDARKLGPYRALFNSEEKGRLEKPRPYGLSKEEWLEQVSSCKAPCSLSGNLKMKADDQ